MWDAAKCNLCGDCLAKCLYIHYDRDKAADEIRKLREGRWAEILGRCITCYACREYCPTGADPFNLIINAIEKAGLFSRTDEQLVAHSFGFPSAVIAGDPGKPALSLCTMANRLPEGALDGRLFQGMTIVKGSDYYCLIGWEHYGHEAMIAKYARRFIDNLAGLGKDIIFLHDDCYAMIHVKVREYGIIVPFNYMHILEYLANYLRGHQGNIIKLNKKVAYQRPCASRYTPQKDAIVDEMFELIGVERPARRYERDSALCCAAPLTRIHRDVDATKIQERNVRDALDCGADALITLCPVCDQVMRRPTNQLGLKQIYITDLCRMALGEKAWPT
jgi:Fe-S oxidoreductase